LTQLGALNRKSRPAKSLADPLGELMKHFNGVIGEFGKFCEYVPSARYQYWHILIHSTLPELTTKTRSLGLPFVRNHIVFQRLDLDRGRRFTEHLLSWNGNKDRLNGFADRIAGLRKNLIGLLSQQATQQPWKHADALAKIESRLAPNRTFYAAIHDANEEIARTFLSNHGGESAVQKVSWDVKVLLSHLLMVSRSRTAAS
jgi:hypothetical protein